MLYKTGLSFKCRGLHDAYTTLKAQKIERELYGPRRPAKGTKAKTHPTLPVIILRRKEDRLWK